MSGQIERDTVIEYEEDEKKQRTGRVIVKEKKLRATVEARDSLRRQVNELKTQVEMLRLTRKKLSDMVDNLDIELKDTQAALQGLVEYERKRHPPRMGGDEFPPSLKPLMIAATAALAKD